MKSARTHILIKNCTIVKVQQSILGFQERYQHYQKARCVNIWSFHLISMDDTKCVIQLIDKSFEPTRGKVCSDAPYIFMSFTQKGEHVDVVCWIEWQKWKSVLILATIGFNSMISIVHIYSSFSHNKKGLYAVILWLCLFIAFIWWLIQNNQHDRLTMRIFRELLQKEYDTIIFL